MKHSNIFILMIFLCIVDINAQPITSRSNLHEMSTMQMQSTTTTGLLPFPPAMNASNPGDFYLDTVYTRTSLDSFRYTYNYDLQPAKMNELCYTYKEGLWENYFRWVVEWEGMNRVSTLEYWQNNKWTGNIRETELFIDESIVQSWLAESWNTDHWEKTRGQSRTFENGLLITLKDEYYADNQLVLQILNTFGYDSREEPESFLIQVYEQGVWVNELRGYNVWNIAGDVETYHFQKWSNSQWIDSTRVHYYYQSPGFDTLIYCQAQSKGEWIDFSKRHKKYDGEGRNISEEFVFWKEYYWDNRNRLEWQFNDNGDVSVHTYMRGDHETWQNGYRDHYLYADPGIIKSELEELGEGSGWVNGYYYEKEFNSLMQVTRYRAYEWSGSWEPGDQYLELTDAQGNLLTYYCNRADIILNTTFTGTKEYREYPGKMEVFPNPSAGRLSILLDLSKNSPVAIKVFDLTGRLIADLYDGSLPAGRNYFEWDGHSNKQNGLIAGTYLIMVKYGTSAITKKVTIIPQ